MRKHQNTQWKPKKTSEDWILLLSLAGTALAVIAVAGLFIFSLIINNAAQTEKRAYEGANAFISANEIDVKRMTCARDSDGDGYGACAVVTTSNEKIYLECPTDWFTVSVLGATSCKEVDTTLKFSSAPKR